MGSPSTSLAHSPISRLALGTFGPNTNVWPNFTNLEARVQGTKASSRDLLSQSGLHSGWAELPGLLNVFLYSGIIKNAKSFQKKTV